VGFKLFHNCVRQHPQMEVCCVKNMHHKDIEIGKDPGYMDIKFNINFENKDRNCSSMCEVQMMLQTILDCKEYLHTVYEITRNVGMWGAIAGGCVTEKKGIKTSKLYEKTLENFTDVKVHEHEKGSDD